MVHHLKIWKEFFPSVKSGEKKSEIRKADREYKRGDVLILHEYDRFKKVNTGATYAVWVTHVGGADRPRIGLKPGYVCLSIGRFPQGVSL